MIFCSNASIDNANDVQFYGYPTIICNALALTVLILLPVGGILPTGGRISVHTIDASNRRSIRNYWPLHEYYMSKSNKRNYYSYVLIHTDDEIFAFFICSDDLFRVCSFVDLCRLQCTVRTICVLSIYKLEWIIAHKE